MLLEQMVGEQCARQGLEPSEYRFRAREVRHFTGWGATQLKVHLSRLVELEYLLVHRASRGQGYCYELLYEGQGKDGRPFVLKLLDPGKLRGPETEPHSYDAQRPAPEQERPGAEQERPAPGRPLDGPRPALGRGEMRADEQGMDAAFSPSPPGTTLLGTAPQRASQLQSNRNGSPLAAKEA
jgi:hypothetical protein